jgi:predicted PurR-regulated permease PerM
MMESVRRERLNAAFFYAFLALLIWFLYLILNPFLEPLAWAAVLAIVIEPWHRRLSLRWGKTRSALAGTAGVTLGIILPVIFLSGYFVRQGIVAAQQLQDIAESGRLDWASHFWSSIAARVGMENVSLRTALQDAAKAMAAFLAGSLGSILGNVIRVVLDVFLILFALFFFLRDSREIISTVTRLWPFEEPLRVRILAETRQLIYASLSVSVVIALVQGSIGGIAFALAGISQPIFWAILMSFLALLPIVGSWPVWIPATIWMFATHQIGRGILLLAICGGVVSLIDNVLRPILMSDRSELNGLMIFLSVLGGITAFGMIGLVLGPVIFSIALAVMDVYARKPKPSTLL